MFMKNCMRNYNTFANHSIFNRIENSQLIKIVFDKNIHLVEKGVFIDSIFCHNVYVVHRYMVVGMH